ncbi:MAG TPA: hypothetical protein VGL61_26085 [Kofleriaceae bacterium]|jgi:tetratricopeptide (TPR) repeat protein
MRVCIAIAVLALVSSCDSRAKASDPAGGRDQKSKEYETCSSSAACADELRCFERTCRRTARSTVGDYYAALGAAARKKGDAEAAIDAYNRALGHYDSEKVALPPDVDCAYGAALADAVGNKEHAELGARVLHRCLLAVPVGSALRDQALADLARLNDAGLDPLALGRTALADVYLTRTPAAPSSDKLSIGLTGPGVPSKSIDAITQKLTEPGPRGALTACWQAYNAASHKDTLTSNVGLKVTYTPSEYEDEAGTFTTKLDPADSPADQCVHDAVDAAFKDLKLREAFQTKLAVTIR